jgi:hypothetical protein
MSNINQPPHAMNEIINRLASLEIPQLGEIAACMFDDTTDEGGIILDAALAALESKMSEADFVRFCEKLAA